MQCSSKPVPSACRVRAHNKPHKHDAAHDLRAFGLHRPASCVHSFLAALPPATAATSPTCSLIMLCCSVFRRAQMHARMHLGRQGVLRRKRLLVLLPAMTGVTRTPRRTKKFIRQRTRSLMRGQNGTCTTFCPWLRWPLPGGLLSTSRRTTQAARKNDDGMPGTVPRLHHIISHGQHGSQEASGGGLKPTARAKKKHRAPMSVSCCMLDIPFKRGRVEAKWWHHHEACSF